MLEDTATAGSRIPAWQQDVRKRRAAILADIDVRTETAPIIIGRSDHVPIVLRINDDVLLILRVVALGSVGQGVAGVADDRIGVLRGQRRIERGAVEGRTAAQGKIDQAVGIRMRCGFRLEIVGIEQGVFAGLPLVGTEGLEMATRRSVRRSHRGETGQQNHGNGCGDFFAKRRESGLQRMMVHLVSHNQ